MHFRSLRFFVYSRFFYIISSYLLSRKYRSFIFTNKIYFEISFVLVFNLIYRILICTRTYNRIFDLNLLSISFMNKSFWGKTFFKKDRSTFGAKDLLHWYAIAVSEYLRIYIHDVFVCRLRRGYRRLEQFLSFFPSWNEDGFVVDELKRLDALVARVKKKQFCCEFSLIVD